MQDEAMEPTAEVHDEPAVIEMAAVDPALKLEPVEFKLPAPPRNHPPTAAQHTWLRSNKAHMRMSHSRSIKFKMRGTLKADGTFIPESHKHPLMDGNGDFSVGMPIAAPKRRR